MRILLAVALLLTAAADAATVRNIRVDVVDGSYVLRSEAWFDADIEDLFETLLDWDLATEYSSVVVESRNLPPDDEGRPGYYSRIRGCILFFCRSFERFGTVSNEPYRLIVASADPARSDFHVSEEHWRFRREDDGTVIVYDLVLKPKFWVPPVIGPYAVKRKLVTGSEASLNRIEAVAKRNSGKTDTDGRD